MFRTRSVKALVTIAAAGALVGGLAACATPAAPAVKAPRVTASAPTYAAHPTYCAPLAVAQKMEQPVWATTAKKTPALDKSAGLLEQVAKAAAADGRKDVAELFSTVAAGFRQGLPTQAQSEKVIALSEKANPVMVKDCGAAAVADPNAPPAGTPAYCALKAAADAAEMAHQQQESLDVVSPTDVKFAAAAKALAAASTASGRGDVAAMYTALAKQALTAAEPTDAQVTALMDLTLKGSSTLDSACAPPAGGQLAVNLDAVRNVAQAFDVAAAMDELSDGALVSGVFRVGPAAVIVPAGTTAVGGVVTIAGRALCTVTKPAPTDASTTFVDTGC